MSEPEELARELGNVSMACRIVGSAASSSTRSVGAFSCTAPTASSTGSRVERGAHPNRVPESAEKEILGHAMEHPTHGTAGVRGWRRRSEAEDQADGRTDQLLARFDPEYRERPIQVDATGELVAVDTFFAGTLKGVGKVYIQTVLDCFSRYVRARLHASRMPVTAVQIVNNHAPFFERHRVNVQTIPSDNGRECRSRPDKHPYELFLQLEEIEHRTTKVGRPSRPQDGGQDALRILQGGDPGQATDPESEEADQRGGQASRDTTYILLRVTENGLKWLVDNERELTLHMPESSDLAREPDDDLPF